MSVFFKRAVTRHHIYGSNCYVRMSRRAVDTAKLQYKVVKIFKKKYKCCLSFESVLKCPIMNPNHYKNISLFLIYDCISVITVQEWAIGIFQGAGYFYSARAPDVSNHIISMLLHDYLSLVLTAGNRLAEMQLRVRFSLRTIVRIIC